MTKDKDAAVRGQDFEKAGQLRDREMELKAKISAVVRGATGGCASCGDLRIGSRASVLGMPSSQTLLIVAACVQPLQRHLFQAASFAACLDMQAGLLRYQRCMHACTNAAAAAAPPPAGCWRQGGQQGGGRGHRRRRPRGAGAGHREHRGAVDRHPHREGVLRRDGAPDQDGGGAARARDWAGGGGQRHCARRAPRARGPEEPQPPHRVLHLRRPHRCVPACCGTPALRQRVAASTAPPGCTVPNAWHTLQATIMHRRRWPGARNDAQNACGTPGA